MMINVNLLTIQIDSNSFLRWWIWERLKRKVGLQIKFKVFQNQFHNLFIYIIVKF